MAIYYLNNEIAFPPPHMATRQGLLAVGGDLRPERLLSAYRSGIFPWYSHGEPILWWSPDPRLVLYPEQLHISRSLSRTIRKRTYDITFDTAFEQVIHACAQIRTDGTWITPEMTSAYIRLHELGFAHSVEARFKGELVGGLYGVSIGRAFFGESMFARMDDASKVCLVYLTTFLHEKKFSIIDCQVSTEHLRRMGARMIPRKQFIRELRQAVQSPSLQSSWAPYLLNLQPNIASPNSI
jgi:leucyl/phenylalanyl-tRNA---protein transferase